LRRIFGDLGEKGVERDGSFIRNSKEVEGVDMEKL
jgi:hypothetical protein